MKTLFTILFLASCITVFAIEPEYSSLREWVEQHNAKDKTPKPERIFVIFDWKDSAIVRYEKDMKLADVLQKIPSRNRQFYASAFRANHKPLGEPVYDELGKNQKKDRSDFIIQRLDVIYLGNGDR